MMSTQEAKEMVEINLDEHLKNDFGRLLNGEAKDDEVLSYRRMFVVNAISSVNRAVNKTAGRKDISANARERFNRLSEACGRVVYEIHTANDGRTS